MDTQKALHVAMVEKIQQIYCLATEQLRIEKKFGGLVAKAYLFTDYKKGESPEDVLCLHVQYVSIWVM